MGTSKTAVLYLWSATILISIRGYNLQMPSIKISLIISSADDVDWEPIDSTKILQLREETIVKCPNLKHLPQCTANHSCLLNLKEDLCERYDYSSLHPREYENLKQKFEEYRSKVVEPLNKPRDHCANPEYWNGVWSSWHDFDIIFENLSVRGKYWQSLYLYAFAWHYRQSALCSCGDSVTFNEGRK